MRMMGLAVVLTLSLTLAPLAAEAQPAGNVVTIGILAIEAFPPIDSFRRGGRPPPFARRCSPAGRAGTQPMRCSPKARSR